MNQKKLFSNVEFSGIWEHQKLSFQTFHFLSFAPFHLRFLDNQTDNYLASTEITGWAKNMGSYYFCNAIITFQLIKRILGLDS